MTPEPVLENGMARLPGGAWLASPCQPAAGRGRVSVAALRGFFVPDRARVRRVETEDACWFADAARPFLARISCLPDEPLRLVSAKLLVAPFASRTGARNVRLVPMSLRSATTITELAFGWAVTATKSRVVRVAVEDGDTLTVRPEALVGWVGKDPSGFCPKLGVLDLVLPRRPDALAYSFHGPCVVWFEGGVDSSLAGRLHKGFRR